MKIFLPLILFFWGLNLSAEEKKPYELGVGLSGGVFAHKSSQFSGESISLLGPDLIANYFFSPHHALTSGLEIYFTLSRLALVGVHVGNKWYFREPPKWEMSSPFVSIKNYRKFSPFVGGEIRRYTYYLSETFIQNNNIEQSGEFYNLNAHVGVDYVVENLKLSGALTRTLLPISATDGRIKMEGTLLQIGFFFNY